MNKLEKSIRHCMAVYGPRIRAGYYGTSQTCGIVPRGFTHVDLMCCDVTNGIVDDIRLYGVGDAKISRDFYGESVDITAPIEDYLNGEHDWNQLISDIADTVNAHIRGDNEEDIW